MSNDIQPEIRFPGFTEDWEQRKLGDITESFSGGTPTAGKSEYYGGDIPFIRSGEISSELTELFITENGLNNSSAKMVKAGDILYALYGATSGEVSISRINGAINQAILAIRPTKNDNSYLIVQWLRKQKDTIISTYLQGGQGNLSGSIVKDLVITLPQDKEEQNKIGAFFKQLDDTIALHQRKLDLLKETKKGFLQKMFPKNGAKVPEIRFPGFTEDWQERKWYDTVNMSTDMVDPKEGEYDDLPHIGPGNIESFTGRILNNVNTVREDNLISGKFHFNSGDIIYGKINPQLAKYAYVNFEGLTSADTYVLKSHNGIIQDFLFVILQTKDFYKYSVSVSMRTGMPKINRDELNQYNYLSPSNIDEQRKIGSFFNQLDNTITLHQRKLDLLKETKKGFLQKMFV